ncbi:MAG: nucleotidyltransferase domain-containing protein [Candidatus Aminicenantes bacterium]|nr:nucleotidyltransferase domain-containing protein [Candidatus Aminicenantes bacterium]
MRMTDIQKKINKIAGKYHIQVIYAFGSRAKEINLLIQGKKRTLSRSHSDLDIGIKTEHPLNVKDKADIAVFFEDLFEMPRVDVVVISEAPIPLAYKIVTGELIFARDETDEAEYQLLIMRMMADILPHLRSRRKLALGT